MRIIAFFLLLFACQLHAEFAPAQFSTVKATKCYFSSGTLSIDGQQIYYAAYRQNAYYGLEVVASFTMNSYTAYELQYNGGTTWSAFYAGNTQTGTLQLPGTCQIRLAHHVTTGTGFWNYSTVKTIEIASYADTDLVNVGKYGKANSTLSGMLMYGSAGGTCLFQYKKNGYWYTYDQMAAPSSHTSYSTDVQSIQQNAPYYDGSSEVRVVTLNSSGAVVYTSPSTTQTGFVTIIQPTTVTDFSSGMGVIPSDTYKFALGVSSVVQSANGTISYGESGTGQVTVTPGATNPTVVSANGTNTDAVAAANQQIGLQTVANLQGAAQNQMLGEIRDNTSQIAQSMDGDTPSEPEPGTVDLTKIEDELEGQKLARDRNTEMLDEDVGSGTYEDELVNKAKVEEKLRNDADYGKGKVDAAVLMIASDPRIASGMVEFDTMTNSMRQASLAGVVHEINSGNSIFTIAMFGEEIDTDPMHYQPFAIACAVAKAFLSWFLCATFFKHFTAIWQMTLADIAKTASISVNFNPGGWVGAIAGAVKGGMLVGVIIGMPALFMTYANITDVFDLMNPLASNPSQAVAGDSIVSGAYYLLCCIVPVKLTLYLAAAEIVMRLFIGSIVNGALITWKILTSF